MGERKLAEEAEQCGSRFGWSEKFSVCAAEGGASIELVTAFFVNLGVAIGAKDPRRIVEVIVAIGAAEFGFGSDTDEFLGAFAGRFGAHDGLKKAV